MPNALAGRVLDTGHLVFVRSGALWAVPFNRDRLEPMGNPVPVVEGVRVEGAGAVQYALADDGTLVFIQGDAATGTMKSPLWVDSDGNEQPLAVSARDYEGLRLSPDGRRAAVEIEGVGSEGYDVWVAELARGTLQPITREDGPDRYQLWSPDGSQLVFTSRRGGRPELFSQQADGTGTAQAVASFDESVTDIRPYAWSPDGGLIVEVTSPDTGNDIGIVALDGTNGWQPLIQTPANERRPAISPNGRWIAYDSNDPGQPQLYIQRFPNLGERRPVTADTSYRAIWSQDGRELFYLRNGPPDALMRVTVQESETAGGDLVFGDPEVFVDWRYFSPRLGYQPYDVSRDGRVLVMGIGDRAGASEDSRSEINVVLNWFEELKARVPVN